MKALVLSGGGARGAYEAGVVRALATQEQFDLICGASVGALNAAFVAQDRPEALESLWFEKLPAIMERYAWQMERLQHLVTDLGGLGAGNPLQNLGRLLHALADMHFLGFDGGAKLNGKEHSEGLIRQLRLALAGGELRRHLAITATNVSCGMPAAFFSWAGPAPEMPARQSGHTARVERHILTRETLPRAVIGSVAIPGLFAPVEITFDGVTNRYADGSIVNNSPIGIALDAGALDITLVFVDPDPSGCTGGSDESIGGLLITMFLLFQQRLLDAELRIVETINAMIRHGDLRGRHPIVVREIRPERELSVGILEFGNRRAVTEAFELGLHDGHRALKAA